MKPNDTFEFELDGQQITATVVAVTEEHKSKIDWKKMPKDTLVEVWNTHASNRYKYHFNKVFEAAGDDHKYAAYDNGATTATADDEYTLYRHIRLIENDWRVWFGGEMPCCGHVRINALFRDGAMDEGDARWFSWSHTPCNDDIIAYKMLAE